jgi:hypothetical protein
MKVRVEPAHIAPSGGGDQSLHPDPSACEGMTHKGEPDDALHAGEEADFVDGHSRYHRNDLSASIKDTTTNNCRGLCATANIFPNKLDVVG